MRAGYGRLGIRCAADAPPQGAALQPEIRTIDGRQVRLVRGLRRFAEAATLCGDFRVATKAELDAFVSQAEIPDVPHWTERGMIWRTGESPSKPESRRSTPRVVCVERGP